MTEGTKWTNHVDALPLGTQVGSYTLDGAFAFGELGIAYRSHCLDPATQAVVLFEYFPKRWAWRHPDGVSVCANTAEFAAGRGQFIDRCERVAALSCPGAEPVIERLESYGTTYLVVAFDAIGPSRTGSGDAWDESCVRSLSLILLQPEQYPFAGTHSGVSPVRC